MIPPPAKASPIGPPGQPTQFTFELDARGALELSWKCKNPRGAVGTMYQVSRRIGPGGELVPLGITGEKRFVDETIPAGSTQVIYQIQAIRSTAAGPIATFNVNFGTGRARSTMTSAMQLERSKLAA